MTGGSPEVGEVDGGGQTMEVMTARLQVSAAKLEVDGRRFPLSPAPARLPLNWGGSGEMAM